MSFLRVKPSIQGLVLAEFDDGFINPYFGSRFDNGSTVNADGIASVAAVLAAAVHRLAGGEPAALKVCLEVLLGRVNDVPDVAEWLLLGALAEVAALLAAAVHWLAGGEPAAVKVSVELLLGPPDVQWYLGVNCSLSPRSVHASSCTVCWLMLHPVAFAYGCATLLLCQVNITELSAACRRKPFCGLGRRLCALLRILCQVNITEHCCALCKLLLRAAYHHPIHAMTWSLADTHAVAHSLPGQPHRAASCLLTQTVLRPLSTAARAPTHSLPGQHHRAAYFD